MNFLRFYDYFVVIVLFLSFTFLEFIFNSDIISRILLLLFNILLSFLVLKIKNIIYVKEYKRKAKINSFIKKEENKINNSSQE